MKKSFYLLMAVTVSAVFFACGTKQTDANKNFVGTYQADLPCADCDGINTILQLKADSTFMLDEFYPGKSGGEIYHTHTWGKIDFGKDGKLSLTDNVGKVRYYELGDSTVIVLDSEGKRAEGETASLYELKKLKTELPTELISYYEGDLPCADCNGIRTILTLLYNGKFALVEFYSKGNNGEFAAYHSSGEIVRGEGGKFSFTDSDGKVRYYELGDSTVTVLDSEGKRVEGETAALYELKKKSNAPYRKLN